MLKESYIANWKNLPQKAYKVRVARPHILSPSKELLWDYKEGRIDWTEYEKRFRIEILNNPNAVKMLKQLLTISKLKDVYLICYEKEYPCHRFILIDMIKELTEDLCCLKAHEEFEKRGYIKKVKMVDVSDIVKK